MKPKPTAEVPLALVVPIMFAPGRVVPLDSKPFSICSFDRTNIPNGAKCRFERYTLTYMIS